MAFAGFELNVLILVSGTFPSYNPYKKVISIDMDSFMQILPKQCCPA